MKEIHAAISTGASAFLRAEYSICGMFVVVFAPVVFLLISWGSGSSLQGVLTATAFVLGASTSIACGYIGMKVAVFTNVRTTIGAQKGGYMDAFNAAFRGGSVVGFVLTGLGLLVLYLTMLFFKTFYTDLEYSEVMSCVAGYGLGGSSVALFGRVGGGIYTKAADVGADLVGKVVHGIPEDDPRNPAVVADLVGDNVGDIAGMGADLFGSFAGTNHISIHLHVCSHSSLSSLHRVHLRSAHHRCIDTFASGSWLVCAMLPITHRRSGHLCVLRIILPRY